MTEAILDTMGAVLARWTMGAAAAPAASVWSADLGSDPREAELRLLALSGQFLAVAVTADPPAGLRTLPDIPALALPTVPESRRPLVRRILAAKEKRVDGELLRFLAARGWTVHPGDWLPSTADDDLPDLYAPWRDWADVASSADAARRQADDELTAETWDDYRPAARKAALVEMRLRDPGGARILLEAKLAGEGADARLRLLGLLAIGLSEADIPFLEAIAVGDRAPKVKALAALLLARLGRSETLAEDAAELAGFFSIRTRGLLRRSRAVQVETAPTPAQRQRRTALFESVDFSAFAQALGLTPQELIAAWSWGNDAEADVALAAQVARTGTDALAAETADAMSRDDAAALQYLAALAPRLAPGQRSEIATAVLRTRDCSFALAKVIAGEEARLSDMLSVPAGAALLDSLQKDDTARAPGLTGELYALGLIASPAAARSVLERLSSAGLLQADPRLDMLRLNAALDDNGASG